MHARAHDGKKKNQYEFNQGGFALHLHAVELVMSNTVLHQKGLHRSYDPHVALSNEPKILVVSPCTCPGFCVAVKGVVSCTWPKQGQSH